MRIFRYNLQKSVKIMPIYPPSRKSEAPAVAQNASPANGITTQSGAILSRGVTIKGSVKFRTELAIDGNVEGTIESVGRLRVGKNAHIRGEIKARSVTVHGSVEGNLTAGERCELRSGCRLRGDIEAPRLVVDEDATFIGRAKIAIGDDLFLPHFHRNGNGARNGAPESEHQRSR
jgi:cytoskeletal protein CcmA (bactofilin family)